MLREIEYEYKALIHEGFKTLLPLSLTRIHTTAGTPSLDE